MPMRIVPFSVKAECVHAFEVATVEHVRESHKEAGILRFEFLRQEQDPTQFVLLIAFKDDAARESHFALAHTHHWRATVTPMLLEPIRPVQYAEVPLDGLVS